MSIFSKFKHAFGHLGQDVANVAKRAGHAVEGVANTLVHDSPAAAKQTLNMSNDLVHLRIQKAMCDSVGVADAASKAMQDVNTAPLRLATTTLGDANINKNLTNTMQKVDKATPIVKDIGSMVTSIANHSIEAAKDMAHGHFGDALKHTSAVTDDALQGVSYPTPAGLIAGAASQVPQQTHIGEQAIDAGVTGALSRGGSGFKDLAKKAAKDATKAEGRQQVEDTAGQCIDAANMVNDIRGVTSSLSSSHGGWRSNAILGAQGGVSSGRRRREPHATQPPANRSERTYLADQDGKMESRHQMQKPRDAGHASDTNASGTSNAVRGNGRRRGRRSTQVPASRNEGTGRGRHDRSGRSQDPNQPGKNQSQGTDTNSKGISNGARSTGTGASTDDETLLVEQRFFAIRQQARANTAQKIKEASTPKEDDR